MTSKERLQAMIDRKPVDRFPADIWMTGEVFTQLQDHFGVQEEQAVYDRLGVDRIFWMGADYRHSEKVTATKEPGEWINEWGARYKPKAYEHGTYLENSSYPMKAFTTVAELEQYDWPKFEQYDFDNLRMKADHHTDDMIMLNTLSLFEVYCSVRSLDEALMDLYINEDMVKYAIERIADIQYAYMDEALKRVPESSLVYFSDDMGMQDRSLISPELYDKFLAGPASRLVDLVHSHGKKVFFHSDGSAFDILSQLIDIGIDVVNPIQYVCPGMEREKLKNAWGDKVVFHGAVENQNVLPFGTPADVRKEVFECMQTLGKDGGYIVAPCHNIQPNTPIENIIALYEAVQDAGSRYL